MYFNSRLFVHTYCYVLFIVALTCGGIILIATQVGIIIGCLLLLASLLTTHGLIKRLNRFNARLKLFIDAVNDKESMLQFNDHTSDKDINELCHSLNRLIELLASSKAEKLKLDRFYLSLLEEIPGGILAWNSNNKIVLFNNSALRLLGFEHLYLVSQLCRQYPSLNDWLAQPVKQKSLLLQSVDQQELLLSINKMKIDLETITILSVKDISNELSEKESESWNKLTRILTHEIMNTIAPIVSLSQTLLTYPDINKKALRGLNIIRTQSERLMDFTESYRHLSFLPNPEKNDFSLIQMLRNLEILMQTDFEAAGVRFSILSRSKEIIIKGDEKQFSQVFLNLLKNSLQALEGVHHPTITIEIEDGDELSIYITDNGKGIPDDLRNKVFVPFFTTKTEGMGIGLSLCRQIVKRHGGFFDLRESRPGRTRFVIRYPR